MEEKNSAKQVVLLRLMKNIEGQFRYIEENNSYTKKEKTDQQVTLMKVSQYLCHFDELEPIINEYFVRKAEKEKWGR